MSRLVVFVDAHDGVLDGEPRVIDLKAPAGGAAVDAWWFDHLTLRPLRYRPNRSERYLQATAALLDVLASELLEGKDPLADAHNAQVGAISAVL